METFLDPTDGAIPPEGNISGCAVGPLLGTLLLLIFRVSVGTGKSEGGADRVSAGLNDGKVLVSIGVLEGMTGMVVVGLGDMGTGELAFGASETGTGSIGIKGAGAVWIGAVVTGMDDLGATVGCPVIGCAKAVQISDAALPLETNAIETVKIGGTLSLVIVP